MDIDDPIKAAQALIAGDERQQSPVTQRIAEGLAAAGIPGADKITGYLNARRAENRALLFSVLLNEVKRLNLQFEALSSEHRRFLQSEFVELVADGLRKAEDARDRERINRMAKILRTTAKEGPPVAADETEEMLRIARELSDNDISVLKAVCGREPTFGGVRVYVGSIDVFNKNPLDPPPGPAAAMPIEVPGLSPQEIQSHCAKLQSFGLVMINAEETMGGKRGAPYGFDALPRGHRFIRFIEG